MPIEYDLVIIGATELGGRMARRAAQMGARVALVEQSATPEQALKYRAVVRASWPNLSDDDRTDDHENDRTKNRRNDHKDDRAAWLNLRVQDDASELSVESLQIAGVDYIATAGAFVQNPIHGFQVTDRVLRSSHYVSALYGDRMVPLGLGHRETLKPEDIVEQWSHQWVHLKGQRVAIVGEMPVGVELAMALRSQGAEVLLVVPTPHILPRLERAFGDRIQMVLETAGVKVCVGQSYESQPIRDRIAEYDTVVLATPLAKLSPERLGLRSLNRSVMKQNQLQLVGHRDELTENIAATAQVEVEKILKPWSRRNPRPNSGYLAGLGAAWIDSTIVPPKTKPLKPRKICCLEGMSWDGDNLWYRVTIGRRGTILSCYFMGDQAAEWSGLLSIAIAAKISLTDLASLSLPNPHQNALITQWLHEWEQQSRSPWHEFFLDWLGFVRRRSIVKPPPKIK